MSVSSLRKSFFEGLWPLILSENPCDTRSKNTSEFFVPERKLDELGAHEFLASKGYKDYEKPLQFPCCLLPEEPAERQRGRRDVDVDVEQGPVRNKVDITPLNLQIAARNREQQHREQLAYDFANRSFPWYVQRSVLHEDPFPISHEVGGRFTNAFERNILRNIHTFHCKLMIIDVGADVGLSDLQRWLKFCKFVQMVAVVRCGVLARRLLLFGGAIRSVLLEENRENLWQEELSRSLDAGVQFAQLHDLHPNCAAPFVFVFSQSQGLCTCDSFKILRKF